MVRGRHCGWLVACFLSGCVFTLDRPRPGGSERGPGPELSHAEARVEDGPRSELARELGVRDVASPDLFPPPDWTHVGATAFTMGSPPNEACRSPDEAEHKVTLTRGYRLLTTEVTQRQYLDATGRPPPLPSQPEHPVVKVSWHDAAAYCNALSKRHNLELCYNCTGNPPTCGSAFSGDKIYDCNGWRLPTEAEWERAYRGSSTKAYYNGVDAKQEHCNCDNPIPPLKSLGWYCGNSGNVLHGVADPAIPANDLGLRDMAGNVAEWVHDGFEAKLADATNPVGVGTEGIIKGGSYKEAAGRMRAAMRDNENLVDSYPHVGFRCARTAP